LQLQQFEQPMAFTSTKVNMCDLFIHCMCTVQCLQLVSQTTLARSCNNMWLTRQIHWSTKQSVIIQRMWRDCTSETAVTATAAATAAGLTVHGLLGHGVSLCAAAARHSLGFRRPPRRQNATVRREPLFLRKKVVSWSTALPLCGRYATYRQLIVQQITDFIG